MKRKMKRIATLALAIIAGIPALAQTGTWSGKLQVSGMELGLVFNIVGDSGTLDVPDQGAKDIPMTVSRAAFGSIAFDVPAINASFKGLWSGKLITGTYSQNGMSLPLTLVPGAPVLRRPQTPVGPFPYVDEDVTFSNGDAVLSGTLALPENCGRDTPVLLMVTGSGLQNRDEEMFGHRPFAVIADAFARAGIATLRYDDRGFGKSTGDVVSCTTEDLKNDALAGVRLLRERFDHVGVLGHSEGGTIALMLAAEGKTDFVVSLAGMVVSGAETLLYQNREGLLAAGMDASDTERYCKLLAETYCSVVQGLPLPSPEVYDLPDGLRANWAAAVGQLKTPYMKYFLSMDLTGILGAVRCPVLALDGTKDMQVECMKNLDALRSGLPENGCNVVKAEEGLNHLFQHCATGHVPEYREIEETFSPQVLSEMTAWIKALEYPREREQ